MRLRAFVCCWVMVLGMGMGASTSWASFAGRDGLLAVQPATGGGLILVNSRGGQQRRLCLFGPVCVVVKAPRWSPDGRVIAFATPGSGVNLIYPDGSCLNCRIAGAAPAFMSNRSLVTVVSTGHALLEDGIDGIQKARILGAAVSDAVWSARGALAVVRSGRVSVGRPGRLRVIGRGSSPSWSPDGSRIAIQRDGWVLVVGVADRSVRRLVGGSAPAWSPDGQSVAFIAAKHELSVIPATGGRARRVGHVHGVAVDWQPIPSTPIGGCLAPPGSIPIATSPESVVTIDYSAAGSSAFLGCRQGDGPGRVLESYTPASPGATAFSGVQTAATSGDYAALVNYTVDGKYGRFDYSVQTYNLRTGLPILRPVGEMVSCSFPGCSIDQVVVGSDAVSAVHTIADCPFQTTSQCPTEQIAASDSTGIHTLDTATRPNSNQPPVLTGLSLSKHTLTWLHDGSPRSAILH